MRTLLVSTAVCATIVGALALGVVLGYGAIVGILRMLGHRPQKQQPAPAPALMHAANAGD